ncbi:putative membrane protein [Roseimarinus sediminis]
MNLGTHSLFLCDLCAYVVYFVVKKTDISHWSLRKKEDGRWKQDFRLLDIRLLDIRLLDLGTQALRHLGT